MNKEKTIGEVIDSAISEGIKGFSFLKEKSEKAVSVVKKEWEESEADRKKLKAKLEKGGKVVVSTVKKEWEESAPDRKKLGAKLKNSGKIIVGKSLKLKKNIMKKIDSI